MYYYLLKRSLSKAPFWFFLIFFIAESAFAWCPYRFVVTIGGAVLGIYALYSGNQNLRIQLRTLLISFSNVKYAIPLIVAIHAAAVAYFFYDFNNNNLEIPAGEEIANISSPEIFSQQKNPQSIKKSASELKFQKVFFTIESTSDDKVPWILLVRSHSETESRLLFQKAFLGRYPPELLTYRESDGSTGVILQKRDDYDLSHSYLFFDPMDLNQPFKFIKKLEHKSISSFNSVLYTSFKVISTTFVMNGKNKTISLFGLAEIPKKPSRSTDRHYAFFTNTIQNTETTWSELLPLPYSIQCHGLLIERVSGFTDEGRLSNSSENKENSLFEMAVFMTGNASLSELGQPVNKVFSQRLQVPDFGLSSWDFESNSILLQTVFTQGILGEDSQTLYIRDLKGVRKIAFSRNDFKNDDQFFLQEDSENEGFYIFQRSSTNENSHLYWTDAKEELRKIGQLTSSIISIVAVNMPFDAPLLGDPKVNE
jgi:hypothetical protein